MLAGRIKAPGAAQVANEGASEGGTYIREIWRMNRPWAVLTFTT
jgi:hypothetical protein